MHEDDIPQSAKNAVEIWTEAPPSVGATNPLRTIETSSASTQDAERTHLSNVSCIGSITQGLQINHNPDPDPNSGAKEQETQVKTKTQKILAEQKAEVAKEQSLIVGLLGKIFTAKGLTLIVGIIALFVRVRLRMA